MTKLVRELKICRLCKSKKLREVINLGLSPTPNTLLKKSELKNPEPLFPLKVNFCRNCNQVQLSHVVSPELMFQNYPYVSSTSQIMVEHFQKYAKTVFKNLKLKRGRFVVEIGSNDGMLLNFFKKAGARVLGVDPAKNIAREANIAGIPTMAAFFNEKIAKEIVMKHGTAKLILANNVFAHINDLDNVMKGVNALLAPNGVFIVEFPYLVDVIENNVFDSIYHEHLSYLAVSPLKKFFEKFGMKIFDVVATPVQGGSIRIFIEKQDGQHKVSIFVKKYLTLEKNKKLDKLQTYVNFAKRISETKKSLNLILKKLKMKNKKIIGYGAPGRSTTLLNYFGINPRTLDYIADDNPKKQGFYTPGTHIAVVNPTQIIRDQPDYILILSWNFAEPIMKKLKDYQTSRVKFIIPIPEPKII